MVGWVMADPNLGPPEKWGKCPEKYKPYGCQPKNRGILPPKWMVKIRENPIKIDDL